MKLNELLDKLPFLERMNDLLVVESDISGLRGAVFARDGQGVRLQHEAMANYDDFNEGLKTLVIEMRGKGWQGQHAVLMNPAVVASLITLPIPPKNKLSPTQIAEQVKWEMDPLVSQQARQLSIGQLLVQQGVMTQAQVDEVLAIQNEANVSQQRDTLYKKFGEQAQLLHFVKRGQLESLLRRQAWFKAGGDQLHCGWKSQSNVPRDGGFSWLASAVNKSLLRQWQVAFMAAGLKLHGCFPMVGNGLAVAGYSTSTESKVTLESAVVYEIHAHQTMMGWVQGRRLMQMQTLEIPGHEALGAMSDFLNTLDVPDEQAPAVVVIDATWQSPEQSQIWLRDIANVLGQAPLAFTRSGEYAHAGFEGVARVVMGVNAWLAVIEVPVGEPAPVWYKRNEFKVGAAVAAMLGLMVVAELSVWVRTWMINSEKSTVDAALGKQREAIAAIQKQVDAVNALKASIASNQEKSAQLKKGLNLLEYDLPKRNQTLVDMLHAFETSVSDEVVVDSMTEDTRLGFTVNAWALNEAAAQEFAKRFQVNVHGLEYRLKDSTVSEQTGRLGLLGYAIKFKATRLNDEEWLAASAALKPLLGKNGKR